MDDFRAFRIDRTDGAVRGDFCSLSLDDLSEGDVVISVSHSTINYKDALAATGKGRILRRYPLVGGIDLAGTVISSTDPDFTAGQPVLVNGCGLSETRDGGYAEVARVPADAVVPIPDGLDPREAMQIGTAGYTAALAIHRMEQNGQLPEQGPIVVTGATGGVGSVAIDMLDGRGYEACALTGKADQTDYLTAIGARRVLLRDEIDYGTRPLETAEWAGAIDNLGGEYIAKGIDALRGQGILVAVGFVAGLEVTFDIRNFFFGQKQLRGALAADIHELRTGLDFVRDGKIRPVLDRALPLSEAPEAHRLVSSNKVTGSVVLLPWEA